MLPDGARFGRLTVRSEAGRASNGVMRYHCDCDCGGKATVRTGRLLKGETTSCGCASIIPLDGAIKATGMSRWQIQDRCHRELEGCFTTLKYEQ